MALSGAKYWMAVKAAFPSRYSFQHTLFYWRRYFRFFPSCFCTIFALSSYGTSDMPRTESSSTVSQGHFVLVLMILGYNPSRLGPWAPMNKWDWPTNCWAPQLLLLDHIYSIKVSFDLYIGLGHGLACIINYMGFNFYP